MEEALIRPARRPAGFIARGPRPRAPVTLVPGVGEDLCYLLGDWRIFQLRRGHRWSLDDLVTAWVAVGAVRGREVQQALDLGCGVGSVLMMVAWALPRARVTGVEAQAPSAALARKSLRWNGADDRCAVLDADLRDLAALPDQARFELVTGTPPYFPRDEGVVSDAPQRGPCRFEFRGGVEDYCAAAARHLAPEGRFVLCAASGQRARLESGARASGLQVVARLDVVPKEGRAPLVSVFTLSRAPAPPRESRLLVRRADGQWSDDFRRLRLDMGMPDRPPR